MMWTGNRPVKPAGVVWLLNTWEHKRNKHNILVPRW